MCFVGRYKLSSKESCYNLYQKYLLSMLGKIKWFIYRLIYTPYYRANFKFDRDRENLHILNSVDTILYILNTNCSVSRFGDGEFQMITHMIENGTKADFYVDSFQHYDVRLASRLLDVYKSNLSNHLVCIPYAFKDSSGYKGSMRFFWEREFLWRKKILIGNNAIKLMGDTNFTRFYTGRCDIKNYAKYIGLLKKIWDGRKILIAEGEQSRLGVGNDLFDNAAEVHRLLCPSTNAFDKYDQILTELKTSSRDVLILLALGHTATILAYDLSKCGYQAIDIGHVDIEYEWMRMNAKRKVTVPNKYVNEVTEGRINTELDDTSYQSQIIGRIL